MRWLVKTKPYFLEEKIVEKFAFLPKRIDQFWVWLEWYETTIVYGLFGWKEKNNTRKLID